MRIRVLVAFQSQHVSEPPGRLVKADFWAPGLGQEQAHSALHMFPGFDAVAGVGLCLGM